MIGNGGRGGLPGGNKRFYARFQDFVNCRRQFLKPEHVYTWYQIPLIAFLVADPLMNPRVSGRPTAITGFLGMSKMNSGRDMVKVKGKRANSAIEV